MNNKPASSLSLRKLILSALVAAPLATLPVPLWATPNVSSTNLTSSAGTSTVITQSSLAGITTTTINTPDRTVLTWTDFGGGASTIAATDIVNYVLPNATSAVLNHVTGSTSTTIDGIISSNGRVLILNPNGIVVSATGNISAAGVTLSTIPETDYNFLSTGNLALVGTPTTDVTTSGVITVGSSGTVALAGQNANVGGTIDAGTLTVTSMNSGTATLAGGLAVGNATASYGNVTVATNGGSAVLTGATNVTISGGNLTVNTVSGTGGGAITQGAGTLNIGNGTGAGNLSITTKGSSTAGAVTLATVQATGGKQLNVTLNSGTTAITVPTGDVQINASTITSSATPALSVTATAGNILSGGSVSASNVALSASAAGKSITYAASGNVTFSTIGSNSTGNVTLTGSGSVFSVPAITTANLVLGGGNLTQTGALTATNATIQSSGNVTLNAANDFGTLVVKNVTGNASITDSNGVIIGNGTAVTGNLSVTATAGTIQLGNAATDAVTVNGNATLTASGAVGGITDLTDNAAVLGTLTLVAGTNNVTLDGSAGNGVGLKSQFGKVSITSATTAKVLESTTLNLAGANVTDLQAYSATSIINSGQLKVSGTATVGAGTATAPGSVALNYHNATVGSGNQIANIRVLTDTQLAGASTIGNYLANNLTVENESNESGLAIPLNIYSAGLPGSVTLTDAANAGISTANQIALTGTLTVNQPNATAGAAGITINNAANQWGAFTANSSGSVTAVASTPYTVNAALSEAAAGGKSASFTSGDALTLGSITSNFTGAGGLAFASAATKGITDSVGAISIYGSVSFTGGSVSITKAGNNFGGISIDTSANNGNATIVEASTLKLVTVNTGTGAFAATSSSGNLIQTTSVTAASAALSAAGNVTLDQTANNISGTVSATGVNVTYKSNNAAAVIGNVTASGNVTVDVSGGTNLAISQANGSTINAFGNTSFVTSGTGVVTVANSGNKFGGLTLTSGSGNISLKELTTVNLKSASTSGTLSVTSEAGNIIDSGSGTVTSTGTANFSAPSGSVTLALAGSNYNTVTLATAGNASIVDGVGNIVLGASNVGGALTVANSAGNISQSGAIVVAGNTTFNASAAGSSIALTNSFNQFGPLMFTVGTGGAVVDELTTLNLRAGTVANGQVTLNTGGNFVTSGSGGSTFLAAAAPSLVINATGTITPGAGSLVVRNGLTVNSSNTKDLSALSLSGNLFGVSPTNQGTGSYTGPGQ